MASKMRSEDYPRGYFESAEGSNYRNYGDDPGWETILNALSLVGGSTFIEMAAAKGWFLRHALDYGYDAYGFDISEYAVSARAPGVGNRLIQHNAAERWPYPDESADMVFGFEFMEHVPEDEVDAVLAEAYRVLIPYGGLVLKTGIIIPDDHPFAGQEDHDHTHVTIKDRRWWEDRIRRAGFSQDDSDHVAQTSLDAVFRNRDWFGRFFVWHK